MSSVHGSSILTVSIFRVFVFFSLLNVSAINRVIQASQSELAWISLRLAHNAPVSLVSTAHNDGIKCQHYSVFILHPGLQSSFQSTSGHIRTGQRWLKLDGQRLFAVKFKMADTVCWKIFCRLLFWILRIRKLFLWLKKMMNLFNDPVVLENWSSFLRRHVPSPQ